MKLTNNLKFGICIVASVVLVGCAGTRYNRSTGQYIDDKATAGRVKSSLKQDSLVKAADIKVASFRGNVHLTGFVDHPIQKERASLLTRNTRGVSWFKNDIVVKESLPGEAEINAGQINEPAGASRDSSYYHRQSFQHQTSPAESPTSGWQRGALNVYDPAANISVEPGPTVRSTSATTSQRGASGLISNESSGSSNELTRRVYTQLRADDSSAAQNVRIESGANGKITLRGMVANEDEKRSIESKVKTVPGVKDVNNELEIQNQ